MAATALGARTYEIDYRMPPDHPYPAALDDCIAAYRALLEDHAAWAIIVRGSSAGGNLAAALMLRARDEGLPFPAGLVLATPEIVSASCREGVCQYGSITAVAVPFKKKTRNRH